jgi:succinate dehydrogenase/fumarate reductase flavoprotein subunit
MNFNNWELEPAIAKRLCFESAEMIEWLISHGVVFDPSCLYISGVELVPRGHMATGYGHAITEALHLAAAARGTEVVLNTRVQELRGNAQEGISGIVVDGVEVTAGSVVLTTGGIGHNFPLLEKYLPDAARHGQERCFYWGVESNQGDALLIGEEIGASVGGYNRALYLRTPDFYTRFYEGPTPSWLVFVNKEGFRFISEDAPYAVMGEVLNKQTDALCYAILDHLAFSRSEDDERYKSPALFENIGVGSQNWEPAMLQEQLAKGNLVRADSILKLGGLIGVPPETLEATIRSYVEDCAKGEDTQFFKEAGGMIPPQQAPYYAATMRCSAIVRTNVGLRIDLDARVIGNHGTPIAGLFAAGECSSGPLGYYCAGGNSLTDAFTYGRIAGTNAAKAVS